MRRLIATALPLRALGDRRFGPAALALLAGVLAARASAQPVTDPDAPWIAALGRELLATGHAPRVNGWSFTAPSQPWVAHEWGLSPLYALALSRFGPWGASLLGAVGASLTLGLLLRLTLLRARRRAVGVGLAFASLLVLREAIFSPRPACVTLALPLAAAALLLRPALTRAHALASVALTVAWANLHGSFPLAAMIAAAGVVAFDDRRGLRVATAFGCALAPLCNPYGPRLYALVFDYAAGGATTHALRGALAEFQPLWRAPAPWSDLAIVAALGSLVALSLGRIASRPRSVAWVSLGLCAMALSQARHVALALTLGLALCVSAADDALDRLLRGLDAALHPPEDGPRGLELWRRATAWCVAAIALGALAGRAAPTSGQVARALGGDGLRALVDGAAGARVVVPFAASGWALWWGLPRGARVFYDARNDCYPEAVARAAFALEGGASLDRVEASRVELVMAPEGHALAEAARRDARWVVSARSGAWSRWERVSDAGRRRPTRR
ncbi:MAG: hypothetical protein R3A52_11745 [Polyangiales bacterium]